MEIKNYAKIYKIKNKIILNIVLEKKLLNIEILIQVEINRLC